MDTKKKKGGTWEETLAESSMNVWNYNFSIRMGITLDFKEVRTVKEGNISENSAAMQCVIQPSEPAERKNKFNKCGQLETTKYIESEVRKRIGYLPSTTVGVYNVWWRHSVL